MSHIQFNPSSLQSHVNALAAVAASLRSAAAARCEADLATALRDNLELWLAISACAPVSGLAPEVRVNLGRLADFVIATSAGRPGELALRTLEGLITINDQIASRLGMDLREAA